MALKWPQNLVFDGLHTLRHGMVGNTLNALLEKMSPATNQAVPTMRHYVRSNAVRNSSALHEASAVVTVAARAPFSAPVNVVPFFDR